MHLTSPLSDDKHLKNKLKSCFLRGEGICSEKFSQLDQRLEYEEGLYTNEQTKIDKIRF